MKSTNPAAVLIRQLGPSGMARNINDVLNSTRESSPDLFTAGRYWYHAGQEIAMKATGRDAVTACGIVAALSPQTSWSKNIENAKTLVETGSAPTLGGSVKKALRILAGEHPLEVLGGRKVRAFYHNLNHPSNWDHVTVDRHAVNIALGDIIGGSQKALDLAGVYDMVQNAYVAVAKESPHVLNPNQVQAASWLGWRTIYAPGWAENDSEIPSITD